MLHLVRSNPWLVTPVKNPPGALLQTFRTINHEPLTGWGNWQLPLHVFQSAARRLLDSHFKLTYLSGKIHFLQRCGTMGFMQYCNCLSNRGSWSWLPRIQTCAIEYIVVYSTCPYPRQRWPTVWEAIARLCKTSVTIFSGLCPVGPVLSTTQADNWCLDMWVALSSEILLAWLSPSP